MTERRGVASIFTLFCRLIVAAATVVLAACATPPATDVPPEAVAIEQPPGEHSGPPAPPAPRVSTSERVFALRDALRLDLAPYLPAASADVDLTAEVPTLTIRVPGDVVFPYARSELKPGARKLLTDMRETLARADPALLPIEVAVTAHTDSIGLASVNQRLSEAQAEQARAALDPDRRGVRVWAEGRGMQVPVADNQDEWGRRRNRRLEIIVVPQQASRQPSRSPTG